jgi:hypothetical protein
MEEGEQKEGKRKEERRKKKIAMGKEDLPGAGPALLAMQ